jgi:putative spermidine/putrescine transport system ATP-binding protein
MSFLELNNICKCFNANTFAVRDFTLAIEKGELVSFLGPSGCGKTTTLRMVAGFETPTEGTILLHGDDLTNKPPNQRNVGMVFQAYALFPNMTVAANIGFGMKIAKKSPAEIQERVAEMLTLIHMPAFGDRYPYQLSGGQQQRVALARALALRPEVLLLDEPLSALDAKIRVSLRSEIRAIQRKLGITAIYVTHDQEEALSISDRVVVMNDAHIEQAGTPFEIYNFPKTEFVAQFVGTLNSFPGTVVNQAACQVSFAGQTVMAAILPDSAHDGDPVTVAIRPERLSFATDSPKANLLQGTIENITFLGAIVRIQVDLGGTLLSMDTFNNPFLALPALGSTAQITCSTEAVLALDNR